MRRLLVGALLLAPSAAAAQQDSTCAAGAADDRSVMVSTTLPDSLPAVAALADAALTSLGYALSEVESRPDQRVSRPRTAWPAGTDGEPWHAGEPPPLQVVVDLERTGNGTAVRVVASALCRLQVPDDGDAAGAEHRLETLAAVEVATALARP